MKRFVAVWLSAALIMAACRSNSKDSVEKADSINRARMESPGSSQPIATDAVSAALLVSAANGEMAEMNLGDLAQQKGTDQRVKSFGAFIVHDHAAIHDQIKVLAARRNVTLPVEMSVENQRQAKVLTTKTGHEFETAWIQELIREHKNIISLLEDAAAKVNDSEIKTFIDNTLPKLRLHLDSARVVQRQIK